ncbi:peptidase S8/S53 domain-containing protein [Trichoderma barbatum]
MARCIREVCPAASLHIARLDVSRKAENQASTLESCCKALKWAIAVGVDVVCMSWTFLIKEPGDDSYEDEFRRLVTEAHKKNIILFGSLPDRGPTVQRSDLAPIGLDEVIRIGSATVHGEGVPENRFGEAEFLFPGEENTEGGEVVKGSSYATAYACGLAAAVLLTIRVLLNIAMPKHMKKSIGLKKLPALSVA